LNGAQDVSALGTWVNNAPPAPVGPIVCGPSGSQTAPMLKTRDIPCLDVADGRVVKGVNFVDIADESGPDESAIAYNAAGADELYFLDITATEALARAVDISVIASGGVSSMDDFKALKNTGVISGAISGRALYDGAIVLKTALTQLAWQPTPKCVLP